MLMLRRTDALAAAALALTSAAGMPVDAAAGFGSSGSKWARQSDFVRTMKAVTTGDAEVRAAIRGDRSDRSLRREREKKREMYRNLLARAVPRPTAGLAAADGSAVSVSPSAAAAAASAATLPEFTTEPKRRGAQQQQQQQQRRKQGSVAVARDLAADDDYYAGDDDEEEPDYGAFGFDPSEFSIKYTACSAISFYSDEMAEGGGDDNGDGNGNGDSVTRSGKFVVFRLCPTEYCNSEYGSDGCGSNYGEYLIPLDVYMEEYAQYKEEMAEAYCEYCTQCMYFEQYFYGNRDRDRDRALEGDDDNYYYDNAAGDDDAAAEETHACKYYDECSTYLDVCEGEEGDDDANQGDDAVEEEEYDRYFECQQWEGGNNNNNNGNNNGNNYNNYYNQGLYIGPQCAEDGYTIEFGVFSDEYCSNYVGDQYSIADVTGMDFGADYLADFYGPDCVTCKESELPFKVPQGDEEDEDDITELCEGLYEEAAKCNGNLFDAESESYYSQNQEANEELVCGFIQNVLNGAYDQNGYIIIDEGLFDPSKLFSWGEAAPSIGQIFGMLALMIGCFTMLVTACFMHRSVRKYNDLKQRSTLIPPEQEINRAESGVMVGRSFSRDYPEGTYVMT